MKKYQDQLNKAYAEYIDKIEDIAEQARQEYLIPYLNKNNYKFISAMGTYVIFDPSDKDGYLMFDLPKRIEKILQLEVEDGHNRELGLWMLDYKPEKD